MIGNEIEILKYLQNIRTETLNNIFEYVTMLGEETLMVILIAVLYFALNKKFAQKLFYICVTSLSINGIVKNFVKLARPFSKGEVTCVRPDTATGYSFPSGHTQTFSTVGTALAAKIKKVWVTILIGVLICLVAFSRIYLGAHYLSDVIVGAILGITLALAIGKLYDKFENKTKLYKYTALAFTPFAIYFLITADLLYADFFKVYGMLVGLVFAVGIEEKFAPLEYDVSWWKKVIRVILGIVIAYAVKEGLKIINVFEITQISLILDVFRYAMLIIVAFGIYPILIKKLKI